MLSRSPTATRLPRDLDIRDRLVPGAVSGCARVPGALVSSRSAWLTSSSYCGCSHD